MKKQKLVKILSMGLSVFMLALSNFAPAYAKTSSDVTPGEYILLTTLASCGIYVDNAGAQWIAAYKGYLKSINDTTMLNQLNTYNNLSWGDTATNVDKLYTSIKDWLSLSDSYGTSEKNYTLPSSPAPQLDKPLKGEFTINSTPFESVNPMPLPDYDFLFGDVYSNTVNGRDFYAQRNVYKPSNVEVFGRIVGYYTYQDKVRIEFYAKDSSSSTGYSLYNVSSLEVRRYRDDDTIFFSQTSPNTWNWTVVDLCSVMNFPIKIFSNETDMQTYVDTGVANNLFSADKCFLAINNDYTNIMELQKIAAPNINGSMQLPADNATAMSAYHALIGEDFTLDTAANKLGACGMEISYQDNYLVEHYKQSADGKNWMVTDVDSLSGLPGDLATYTPKTYEGFTFDDTATTPTDLHIPGNGSLVIKLYYKRDEVNYTVEHYKQSIDGNSWMITDAETLSGLPGQPATYTPKTYEGFNFDDSSTIPDAPLISDDGSLIIKLFYKRNSINYKVEHYQQNVSGNAWTKVDTDSFTGLYGTAASCPAKSYANFYCDTSLTVPDNLQLLNNNLTVKLYYRRINIEYTVNHYQQTLKDDWALVDTDTLTGLYGADVKYTAKEYPGFAYDSSLTNIADKTLEKSLVIDLYYKRKDIKYTVEHYQGQEREDMFIDWMLAETEELTGPYGSKATYTYKNYTGFSYDARLTSADNLTLTKDNEVVIKMYYIKPFGVGVVEDMANDVADVLTSAAWVGLGFITTGIVGLYCVQLYKNTVLQAVGYDKDLTKKAKATPGNMPKSKMSMRDKAMLKPSSGKKQTSRKS